MPFAAVLVANRGEIACRIIATLRRLGIRSVAVYSEADRFARHVMLADEAISLGGAAASESYLNVPAVIAAAVQSGAQAVDPGYGFLSESTALAAACAEAGIVFVGPAEHALAVMGDKIRSKRHVAAHGVPVTPGSEGALQSGDWSQSGETPLSTETSLNDEQLSLAAERIGYPLLVKPSAGGGGKGMQVVQSATELAEALRTARRVAAAAFADDTLFLERLIERPRHIEVQVLADTAAHIVHLGERECSLQRRHQKVIEEAPSVLLSAETRARIGEAACAVARSVGYIGAGTVEFLVSDAAPDEFFFMEMNTRLQVEHPVTELVTGIDIVEWQLRVAAGQLLPWAQSDIVLTGHAVEARVYAEDATSGFLPTTGRVLALSEPGERIDHGRTASTRSRVRVDSALQTGLEVGAHYDPLLSKVIAWAPDRAQALTLLDTALADTVILGIDTNIAFLRGLLAEPRVRAGQLDTEIIAEYLAGGGATAEPPNTTALAVAAALLHHRKTSALSEAPTTASELWRGRSGWRLGGLSAARPAGYTLVGRELATDAAVGGGQHIAERFVHTIDSSTLRVTSASALTGETAHTAHIVRFARPHALLEPSGCSDVEIDGVTRTWHYALDGHDIWLASSGVTTFLSEVSRDEASVQSLNAARHARQSGESGAAHNPEVRTPMPGTIVAVHAASGTVVSVGDAVLSVEAMKMEHQLTAGAAGIVHLVVGQGDSVHRNQVVATIEVPAAAAPHDSTQSSPHKTTEESTG